MMDPFYALITEVAPPDTMTPTPPVSEQHCSNCFAFRDGYCHFNPPTMLLRAPVGGAPAADAVPHWTEVKPEEWCAQWKAIK